MCVCVPVLSGENENAFPTREMSEAEHPGGHLMRQVGRCPPAEFICIDAVHDVPILVPARQGCRRASVYCTLSITVVFTVHASVHV